MNWIESCVPLGFQFHPAKEELMGHYLKREGIGVGLGTVSALLGDPNSLPIFRGSNQLVMQVLKFG